MSKKLFLITLLFSLVSCTKKQPLPDPICKAVFRVTAASATALASALQCNNTAAIAGDLSDKVMQMGLCAETTQQSVLTDLVCPQLSALVASMAISSIPASWECSATVMSDIIRLRVQENCHKMIK